MGIWAAELETGVDRGHCCTKTDLKGSVAAPIMREVVVWEGAATGHAVLLKPGGSLGTLRAAFGWCLGIHTVWGLSVNPVPQA